jgi:hypothetical protein
MELFDYIISTLKKYKNILLKSITIWLSTALTIGSTSMAETMMYNPTMMLIINSLILWTLTREDKSHRFSSMY